MRLIPTSLMLLVAGLVICFLAESSADSQASVSVEVEEHGSISDEEFEQHVTDLKTWIPRGFKVFIQKPFVVIGNDSKQEVRRRARGTVKWAVEHLKKDYFAKDPDHIIDIWIFRDGPSYRKFAKELFGHTPDTPYGYYSESDKAMIMNIGTGGGTLIHEIVHPFMAANFPNCPPWFNEGMGSLYEHSGFRNGSIWGLTNWRLTGLRQAIRRNMVPSFEVLMSQNEHQFYEQDPGTNYSQSRYLLQYMQEKRLLKRYYHEFLANRHADPSGFETLKRVLGTDDMDAFKKKWQRWVRKLKR
ncbi:MAG: M1 family metallopeptidase [Deltaproteobacteria bacterium]|nr:M1 family metallopeptidase [Deltaproteobacteria bacterium]